MPQLTIYLPPPTNWQDFQLLIKAIAEVRYDPASVMEYGRSGQRQNGVDVYAVDYVGAKFGIQCKETKGEITVPIVRREADSATAFSPKLDVFIIATTDRTNTVVQDAVNSLNAAKQYPFKVRVEFWEDLVRDINRFSLVLNQCYETYRQAFQQSDEANHLACVRMAFDRAAFKDDFLRERSYTAFEQALVETKRFFRTGLAFDQWAQTPISQTVPVDRLPAGTYKDFVDKLERDLEKIYQTYLTDRKRILSDGRFAEDRAGQYNILRRKLLTRLNDRLFQEGLPVIAYAYA